MGIDVKNIPADRKRIVPSGSITLVDWMGDELDIVNAARISFDKQSDNLIDRDIGLIKFLWKNRHTSPFEMCEIKFLVTCPIPISKQWMRHRSWSYNELSRRYTSKNIDFYIPWNWNTDSKINKQASEPMNLTPEERENLDLVFSKQVDSNLFFYKSLLNFGISKEQARFILPQALNTTFYAKVDLKNLMDFLMLRLADDAQFEIREYAKAIVELLEDKYPTCMNLIQSGRWQWVENDQT